MMPVDPGLLPLALALLALLALCTVPLAAAAFFAGAFLLWLNPAPLPDDFILNYSLAMRLNSPALISIPLFALAGELAVVSGITDRLLNLAGILPGTGRAAVGGRAIVGCALFAGVSGVGPAAVTAGGGRLLDGMIRAGFPAETAAGSIASAAGLSIIIPASVPLTIYAATTGIATNIVFAASFLPGLLAAALLLASLTLYLRLTGSRTAATGKPGRMARPNTALLLRESVWSILLPLLVLSALFSGFLTAPEAAAFASAYAAVVGLFVHKTITTADVQAALSRAAVAAGTVLLLAGVGALFAALMEAAGFSNRLGDILYAFAGGRIGSLILLNLILLAAGCVLDMPAIISLLLPLLLPLAARCGLSTPHFGAMVAVNLAVGLVTPPQAYNIEAAARLAGVGMWPAARGAWPCLAAMLVALAAVAGIPEISLWLPRACGWPV